MLEQLSEEQVGGVLAIGGTVAASAYVGSDLAIGSRLFTTGLVFVLAAGAAAVTFLAVNRRG
jgi:hypothetical protein